MAGQCHPLVDMLHMIKHDPSYLKVTTRLHLFHQIASISISIHKHHKEEHFFSKFLSKEMNTLNVFVITFIFESHNVGKIPFTS